LSICLNISQKSNGINTSTNKYVIIIIGNKSTYQANSKAGKGTTEKRAWVFCLWAEAFFCLDFFGYFLYQDKK
jgi:hypothetical protein